MRILGSLLLPACLALTGCSWFNTKPKPNPTPAPVTANGAPKVDDLVGYLNREADRLAAIQSEDVDLTVKLPKGSPMEAPPTMRCVMACEKPRSFRLSGAVLGTDYLDIGSNNDQFWFWVKDGAQQPLYYCNYTDYEKGVKLPMPFQPEWVVQALGMAKYDPSKPYRVEMKGNTIELIEDSTLQGQPIQKITIFNAKKSNDPSQPQVVGHIVKESNTGKVICQATVRRVRGGTYRTPQGPSTVFYPSDVLLEWPTEQLSMTLKIGKSTVNQRLSNEELARYFKRPDWQGLNKIDLARYQPPVNPTSQVRQAANFGN